MKKFSIYRTCREIFPDENPDWREPYRHIDKWTDDAVAFEFLRRNREYWSLVDQLYQLDSGQHHWPGDRLGPYCKFRIEVEGHQSLMNPWPAGPGYSFCLRQTRRKFFNDFYENEPRARERAVCYAR